MLPYLAVIYALAWVAMFMMSITYKRRLKALYPEIATRLHLPLMEKSMATDLRSATFLLRGHFRQLDNKAFVRFCEFYRAWSIGVFALLIVVGVVIVSQQGTPR